MKKFLLWQYMLNKRLLHKKEFLILLCLIPLLVVGMTLFSEEDSGVVTVLLCMEDEKDTVTGEIIDSMLKEDSIIRYKLVDKEEAYRQVQSGEADCAWIFREDFQNKLIGAFIGGEEEEKPVIVVAQEDNVALQLARTKLYGNVFPKLAFLLCKDYLETEVLNGEAVSEEELQKYYEANAVEGGLVQTIYVSPDELADLSDVTEKSEQQKLSYLVTPIRGLLMILLIVAGLVVTMYYMQDGERGMFAWIPVHKRRWLLYSYVLGAVTDTAVVVLLSLVISERKVLSLREFLVFLLYLPVTAVFCEFVKILCSKKEHLAKSIPLLSIAMLGLCPVFLDLGRGFAPQYLFPPTYFLRGSNDYKMIFAMLGYACVLFLAGTIYYRFVEEKN
ncbi:MAG: ABC transporter permease [Lachnospiraceae bacterium]|nr:ABC transporter permease [Lachnospiraceae bacterium]